MDAEELRRAGRRALSDGRYLGAAQYYRMAGKQHRCPLERQKCMILALWAEDIARWVGERVYSRTKLES